MLTRYYHDSEGQPRIKALVYLDNEHDIKVSHIDVNARKICSKLSYQGYETYIVGGAIRDLLLGFMPKDFDIATSASPNQVKNVFRNSRIIGKRFRLVHVYFKDGNIHEVATFRAPQSGDRNHVYGNLNEDVWRRDFSMNALYYDPGTEQIIDFVGGVKDIRDRVLRSVIPLKHSFREDPVRMLRAVKYASMAGMRIPFTLVRRVKKDAALLAQATSSRLSEELAKILRSGNSEIIFRFMHRFGLLAPMLPALEQEFVKDRKGKLREKTFLNLASLDADVGGVDVRRSTMLYKMFYSAMEEKIISGSDYWNQVQQLKSLLLPLIQPNREVEEAVRFMFARKNIEIPNELLKSHSARYRPRANRQGKRQKNGVLSGTSNRQQ